MPSVPKYFMKLFLSDYLFSNFFITLIVKIMSSVVLPRERSAMGMVKPWRMGPAMVKLPNCSRDL